MTDMNILEIIEMALDYLQTICLNHEDDCECCPLSDCKGRCMLKQQPDDWQVYAMIQNMKDMGV